MQTKIKDLADITSASIFAIGLSFGATQALAGEPAAARSEWCAIDRRHSDRECNFWCGGSGYCDPSGGTRFWG